MKQTHHYTSVQENVTNLFPRSVSVNKETVTSQHPLFTLHLSSTNILPGPSNNPHRGGFTSLPPHYKDSSTNGYVTGDGGQTQRRQSLHVFPISSLVFITNAMYWTSSPEEAGDTSLRNLCPCARVCVCGSSVYILDATSGGGTHPLHRHVPLLPRRTTTTTGQFTRYRHCLVNDCPTHTRVRGCEHKEEAAGDGGGRGGGGKGGGGGSG